MNKTVAIGAAVVVLAVLVGVGGKLAKEQNLSSNPGPSSSVRQSADPAVLAGLQEEVKRLQAEHARLSNDLSIATQGNARLAKVGGENEHAVWLFKELAEQSSTHGQDPTNVYPTIRHVYAGIGRQNRLAAEMEAKWGDVEEDKLPPEEQKAMQQAMFGIAGEMLRLQGAAEQMKTDPDVEFPQPASPEAMVDYSSCYLYGALDLNADQFASVYAILQRYYSQAAQQDLLLARTSQSEEAETNRHASLDQLDADARGEVETLLSPQQAALLSHSPLKQLKFVASKFYPPGVGIAFGAPATAPAR